MERILLLQLIVFLFSISLFGQHEHISPCGTLSDEKVDIWLREIQQDPNAYKSFRENQDIIYLPLTIHIIGTDEGQNYFPEQSLFSSMCKMNQDFLETGISFYIAGDILYHDNTRWFEHQGWQVGNEMHAQVGVPNTINCYINDSANGNCGYAFLGGTRMYLNNSCMSPNGGTFTHEMGHTLTLPHTFNGWEGNDYERGSPAPAFIGNRAVEKVDSSNCLLAGDGFCDTPPDYISSRWTCNNNGESNILLIDPDSTTFRAMGANFMSYSNDVCMNLFTEEQITAMRVHTLSQKSNMVRFDDPIEGRLSSPESTLLFPINQDTLDTDSITFSWTKVENAESYQFQLSRFGSFALREYDLTLTDTFITVASPTVDRRYFWRAKPNSEADYCHRFGGLFEFTLDRVSTSTRQIDALDDQIIISPTVVNQGETPLMHVNIDRELQLDVSLIDLSGQILQQQNLSLHKGSYQIYLRPLNLPSGMYIYRLESEQQFKTYRVIVH